ncbi:MAG: response regulator [Candidatus Eisenbacteria bacterium]|nr:response regulator [Candidatus Eisenbacteria bacterium]
MSAMGEKQKVMIVDDDRDLIDTTKAILEASGYEVAVAYDGPECLEKVAGVSPDLIIMDLMMGSYTEGLDTIKKLQEDPTVGKTPMILMTSVDMRSPIGGGMEETLPVEHYLVKPVDPAELIKTVQKCLER